MNNKLIIIAIIFLIQLLHYSQSTCIKQPETTTSECKVCNQIFSIQTRLIKKMSPLLYSG
jgi:hypothetical protein